MSEHFDVFLSHNSRDKEAVEELGELLKQRRMTVWLDKWELTPGRPWQEVLEEAIHTTQSAAVLVGSEGIGPWQQPEMRAALSQFVKRGLPVIPVLLPGAPTRVDLPLFLESFTWVDCREGFSKENIDRLVWGIEGRKPIVGPPSDTQPSGPIDGLARFLRPEFADTMRLDSVAHLSQCGEFFRPILSLETTLSSVSFTDPVELWQDLLRDNERKSLTILGDHGVGKSTLVTILYLALSKNLLASNLTPLFINVGETYYSADKDLLGSVINSLVSTGNSSKGPLALLIDGLSLRERDKALIVCKRLFYSLGSETLRRVVFIAWASTDGLERDISELLQELQSITSQGADLPYRQYQARISSISLAAPDCRSWVDSFVFVNGLLKGRAISDPEVKDAGARLWERVFRLFDKEQSIDQFLLSIIYQKISDQLYLGVHSPATFFSFFCAQSVDPAFDGRQMPDGVIREAAKLAFEDTIEAFEKPGTFSVQAGSINGSYRTEAWKLISESNELRDFLTAWHMVALLCHPGDTSEEKMSVLRQLGYDFPQSVNKHLCDIVNSTDRLTDAVVSGIKSLFNYSTKLDFAQQPLLNTHFFRSQNLMCYTLGRLQTHRDQARRLLDRAEGFNKRLGVYSLYERSSKIPNAAERIALKTTYRTISVSRIRLGDEENGRRFLVRMLEDRELAAIDRGYHLIYYGDVLPSEAAVPQCYANNALSEWNKSYRHLRGSIQSELLNNVEEMEDLELRVQHHLFTLASFVQARASDTVSRHEEQRTEQERFLMDVLEAVLIDGSGIVPEMKQYLEMVYRDLKFHRTSKWRAVIDFYRLKWEPRRGWLVRGIEQSFNETRAETVADHSMMCMVLATLLLPEELDGFASTLTRKSPPPANKRDPSLVG